MSDRFKFRVWNPDGKYYDDDPQYNVCVQIDQTSGLVLAPFHNNIIEQCTGLKDKNGNLIYEGDIIKDWRGDSYKVVWLNDIAQFFGMNINDDTDGYCLDDNIQFFEIIGNIHEQKEQ